jgi:polyphosphate kinase 2 (PPK2 family)
VTAPKRDEAKLFTPLGGCSALLHPIASFQMGEPNSDIRGPRRVEDLNSALHALRDHLAELQLPQIAHGRRAIILFEGPLGSGKKFALKQLAAAFDPCHVAVHSSRYDRRQAGQGHWLAPYWSGLPAEGSTSVFFRSWYRHVLDDLVLGRTDPERVERLFDEINEFEAQQRDYGTLIVKLYFKSSPEVQDERLARYAQSPWRGKALADEAVRVADPVYAAALERLRKRSDTRWSPWRTIDSDNEQHAALAALEAISECWSKEMPAGPREVPAPARVA